MCMKGDERAIPKRLVWHGESVREMAWQEKRQHDGFFCWLLQVSKYIPAFFVARRPLSSCWMFFLRCFFLPFGCGECEFDGSSLFTFVCN